MKKIKIDVFDSFATANDGSLMHFDVFVESGTSAELALLYGQKWLETMGENSTGLKQSFCNFCHSEVANPEVAKYIKQNGYFILQMEGCPSPYQ